MNFQQPNMLKVIWIVFSFLMKLQPVCTLRFCTSAFAFTEQRRSTGTTRKDGEDNYQYCVYDSDISTGFGVGAFLFLMVSQVLIMVASRCFCCGKALNPGGSRACTLLLFIICWTGPVDSTALFISLAVVIVQITLVAWDTRAQKQVISVVNKLMWAACISTCGAFLAIAFVVIGKKSSWMAITITVLGAPILVRISISLCYFVFRQHFGTFGSDSHRLIKRASGSKSFSWSYSANISDLDDYNSD
ncbi:Ankyrin repeat-containing protein [Abeliophyllum distichum]|uniref:Ankyrin repeat-containing protein n=1 Tax=Abeliophyllum distichum TaxID=126358 RepID=A0ABD1SYU8_9LAMI